MNLTTRYLGLTLRSPFVVGASPLCDDLETARQLEDAGAGALVMRSLFEEQIAPPGPDHRMPFPEYADYQLSPDRYVTHLRDLKRQVSIPVIASLNGHQRGSWTTLAPRLERAGADAIELNFYQVVTDPAIAADQVETEMLAVVGEVAAAVKIPVAVKLSPFHSALTQLAVALELEGAAGTVLFNRFFQPEIDPETMEVQPVLRLSEPGELLLRLRWLAILSPQVRGSLAISGGVRGAEDAVRAILAGAHAVQVVSAVLRHGPEVLAGMRQGLNRWMKAHGMAGLDDFRGLLNLARTPDPSAYERANYIRVLQARRP